MRQQAQEKKARPPVGGGLSVEIVSVGKRFKEAELEAIRAVSSLGFNASILEAIPLKRAFFLPNGQVDAEALLSSLPPGRSGVRVYLLGEDATVKGMNFVFGLAIPFGGRCLVALPRLLIGEKELFGERVRKEVLHELGHVLGLSHCGNPYCVMRFSNSLYEVDEKGEAFCRDCLSRLEGLLRG